jgi:hypothetical protein
LLERTKFAGEERLATQASSFSRPQESVLAGRREHQHQHQNHAKSGPVQEIKNGTQKTLFYCRLQRPTSGFVAESAGTGLRSSMDSGPATVSANVSSSCCADAGSGRRGGQTKTHTYITYISAKQCSRQVTTVVLSWRGRARGRGRGRSSESSFPCDLRCHSKRLGASVVRVIIL